MRDLKAEKAKFIKSAEESLVLKDMESYKVSMEAIDRAIVSEAALHEVCLDLACDDQCPYGEPEFKEWPECKGCQGNTGEIHQNTERDTKCWERYYTKKALASLKGGEK